MDWYSSTFSLMILSLTECFVISWIYGTTVCQVLLFTVCLLSCDCAHFPLMWMWYAVVFSEMPFTASCCLTFLLLWTAGTERFYYDMSMMLGYKPCKWWGYCWRFITPCLIGVCDSFTFAQFRLTTLHFLLISTHWSQKSQNPAFSLIYYFTEIYCIIALLKFSRCFSPTSFVL